MERRRAIDIVDRKNVRVIQRRGGARFLLEAAQSVGISRECRRQNFDRDIAHEPRIARSIDFAHAARADERADLIRAEVCAGWNRHLVTSAPQPAS